MANPQTHEQQLAAGWQALERNNPGYAEAIARAALHADGTHIEFIRLLGASLFVQERYQEAVAPFREVLRRAPTPGAGYHLGYCYLAMQDARSASEVLEKVVRESPQMGLAHNLLGISLVQQARHEEAVVHFTAAVRHSPDVAGVHTNLGNALSELGRHEDAIPHLQKAARLATDDPQVRNSLGNALFQLGQTEEAIAHYRIAVTLAPDYALALRNLASALLELKHFDEALGTVRKSVSLDPNQAEAHVTLGVVCQELRLLDEALSCHVKALALEPDHPAAHANLGVVHRLQGRFDDAIASLRTAVSLKPDYADALQHLGVALQESGRLAEAEEYFRKVIALEPGKASGHHNLGIALQGLSRHEEAIACFREARKLEPGHRYTLGALIWSELLSCSWDAIETETAELKTAIRNGLPVIEPFALAAVSGDPEEQQLCAGLYFTDRFRSRERVWKGERYGHGRIRVAYLSGDFREHAVAYCIAELLEVHDRSRFEIVGASFGPDDGGPTRSRILRAFDRVIDLGQVGDREAAGLLREAEIDIAVDLMGYTRGARPGILAHRPAPVQAGYLGYPGTAGADFLDYILADRHVLPEAHQPFFSEKVAYLPDSYQVNDRRREVAGTTPARSELGLPESGFVFCCFNNSYKIAPRMFDVWMRLLERMPGSVLWTLADNEAAATNLRREALARGVAAERIVFAARVPAPEYRARCRLADLFLDTLPYNGHGTTGDMLWCGVPVLTCEGTAFPGRVAGSLLRAAGLPELIAADLAQYEAKALELAGDRPRLAALRGKLARNRDSAALFDTDRFRRHIEAAYVTMWESAQRGEAPRSFSVPA